MNRPTTPDADDDDFNNSDGNDSQDNSITRHYRHRRRIETDESSWLDRFLFLPTPVPRLGRQSPDGYEHLHANSVGHENSVPNINSNGYIFDYLTLISFWSNFVSKRRWFILILTFCILWPVGYVSFRQFTKSTDSTFHPVPNSPSARAQQVFSELYANDWSDPMHPVFMVLLESSNTNTSLTNTKSLAYPIARNFSLGLENHLEKCSSWNDDNVNPCNISNNQTVSWTRVTSYYSLHNKKLFRLAKALATPDGHALIIQIQYILPLHMATSSKDLITSLLNTIKDYGYHYKYYEHTHPSTTTNTPNGTGATTLPFNVSYTGLKFFQSDLAESTQSDLRHMDMIVFPSALLLLGIALPKAKPLRFWVVPLVTVISTVCLWSILMHVIVVQYMRMQITQFTPSIMMSLTFGMGIDYTLFLLSRFVEDVDIEQPQLQHWEYEREHDSAREHRHAYVHAKVNHMLQYGGHVVVISGVTLMCTFFGLCFLPLKMLKSVGIGASVAIGSALFVNFSVLPALLSTSTGTWITGTDQCGGALEDKDDGESYEESVSGNDLHVDLLVANSSSSDELEHDGPPPLLAGDQLDIITHAGQSTSSTSSFWFRLGLSLVHPFKSISILVCIILLLFPVARFATQVKSSISFDLLLPASSPSLQAFHRLSLQIGPGHATPYRLLFDGRQAKIRMDSAEGFDIMHRVVIALMAIENNNTGGVLSAYRPAIVDIELCELAGMTVNSSGTNTTMGALANISKKTTANAMENMNHATALDSSSQSKNETQYSGIAIIGNEQISHRLFTAAKACSTVMVHSCPFETLRLLDYIDSMLSSKDHAATYITATLGINPFSEEGVAWLVRVQETLSDLEGSDDLHGIHIYIEGGAAIAYDAVEAVYTTFPKVILLTMLVVFSLMGMFFQSIITPLRSIISIGLTLSFVYGLGVLVYQHGVLNWTGVPSWSALPLNEVSWIAPTMAFSIIVGLALDYDIFLISRILEYRMQGYDHKSSILAGLDATGSIITASGMIMAVALGGLMLSTSPALYQWSFLLTVAVLLDTFVIRTLVVPITMSFTGKRYSWWPRNLPEECVHLTQVSDEAADDIVEVPEENKSGS